MHWVGYDMDIVRYKESYRAQVIQLWCDTGLVAPQNDPDKDINRKIADSPQWFLLGIVDHQVVATAMAGYDGHRGWVNYLAVTPDRQKQGLALLLMAEIERLLLAEGCAKINLQIRETNQQVIAAYQAMGYTIDPVVSMGKRLIPDQ